ncbi:hATC-domain-containing protein [Punctularia strigosozonata HHB-11173 SS5]|uniref:hATC-domain-containing protein n=1 Tax=Punctularia strigosozonata (strain HHB-11173) TaxID=741275 RepID=UPI000441666D|nr:hATC-domain-containing protein [Punctularia strigosozonata HHB-11173 SS5]EIN07956.1 hATC-domain-containing protein [Punctularia strigosozonata HHB-11173 SS5]
MQVSCDCDPAQRTHDADDRLQALAELDRYCAEPVIENGIEDGLDLLWYWQTKRYEYPLLYRIALDILPAQASSVSCERFFSSAKETDTLRRNRLSPELMEVLQFLKSYYRRESLSFTEDFVARPEDYAIEGPLTEYAYNELRNVGPEGADELRFLLADSTESSHT